MEQPCCDQLNLGAESCSSPFPFAGLSSSSPLSSRPAGEEKPTIWIEGREENGKSLLVIRDNGEGIEPQSLPHVFERFRQSESGAKKGGLGLGLAIARYVVEAHHGSVSAMSEGVGHGATFIARFPLAT